MNNTRKRTTLAALVLMLTAATLVVGGTFAVTPSAFAYKKDNGNGNGNTITPQINKQYGIQSGFDTSFEEECQNLICTHPGSGATCVSEGSEVTPGTGTLLVKKVVDCREKVDKCPLPEDFTITVTGNHPDPASFPRSGTGTLVTLGVGPYKVNETPLTGFDVSFSADCTDTIAAGDQKTCTVTNTEQEK